MMPENNHSDLLRRPEPNDVRMSGLLAERFSLSHTNRLLHQEEDHLLFPFQLHCPVGFAHPDRPRAAIFGDWQGEYLGTWLNAAALTVQYADDDSLRSKIDAMFTDWIATIWGHMMVKIAGSPGISGYMVMISSASSAIINSLAMHAP